MYPECFGEMQIYIIISTVCIHPLNPIIYKLDEKEGLQNTTDSPIQSQNVAILSGVAG